MTNITTPIPANSPDKKPASKSTQKMASTKPAQTKKARLIVLLKTRNGARTPTICKSLGWQKHTVRAALSGLRKEGHLVVTSKSARDGVTVYRIESGLEAAV